jgi:hypothetical protein
MVISSWVLKHCREVWRWFDAPTNLGSVVSTGVGLTYECSLGLYQPGGDLLAVQVEKTKAILF